MRGNPLGRTIEKAGKPKKSRKAENEKARSIRFYPDGQAFLAGVPFGSRLSVLRHGYGTAHGVIRA